MRKPVFQVAFVVLYATSQFACAQGNSFQPSMASNSVVELRNTLSLKEALLLASTHSPVLRGAHQEIEAAEGAVIQASRYPNPVLSTELEDLRRSTRKTTVLLGIPLELSGQRPARVTVAISGKAVASAEFENAQSDVRAAVTQAFFDVVVAQERVLLVQGAMEVAQKATEIAVKRVSAGKVSPIEETRARVAQANSALEIVEAKAELESTRFALAATWGSRSPAFTTAVTDFSDFPAHPDWATLEERLARSPQLAVARAEVEKRQTVTALEQNRRHIIPTLNIGTKRDQEVGRTELLVGVSLPLPLFDRNQGNIAESFSRVEKARAALDATHARLFAELRRAAAKLNAARESSEALKSIVLPGAEQAYRTATRGFDAGKFSFLEVLDTQRTYFQARAQYLQVLANAYAAAATIDRILGI